MQVDHQSLQLELHHHGKNPNDLFFLVDIALIDTGIFLTNFGTIMHLERKANGLHVTVKYVNLVHFESKSRDLCRPLRSSKQFKS